MNRKPKRGGFSTVLLKIPEDILAEIEKKAALAKKDRDTYLIELAFADVSFGLATQTNEDGIVVMDKAGYIRWVNISFCIMCGYTLRELSGKKRGNVLHGPATDPASIAILHDALREKRKRFVQILNYHKDGQSYWVRLLMAPIEDPGRELGFVAIERKFSSPESLDLGDGKIEMELESRLANINKAICANPSQFGLIL